MTGVALRSAVAAPSRAVPPSMAWSGDSDIGAGPGEPGLVSVVIPSFNRAYVIGETIRSVLAQTYRQVEIIVVDDGSTDDTRDVVTRLGDNVRYLHQDNAGVSAARNTGLRAARGEFIALLDSDDSWLPWKLETQVRFLRAHPEAGMVFTDMIAVDEAGAVVQPTYMRTMFSAYERVALADAARCVGRVRDFAPGDAGDAPDGEAYRGDFFRPMFHGNLVLTSTALLRRDRLRAVGGFDESLHVSGEDYQFHLRTCARGEVGVLDVPSVLYRVNAADQLTAPERIVHIARNNLKTVQQWLEQARGRVELPRREVRSRLAASYAWLGSEELRHGNRSAAARSLLHSLALRPWQPRTMAFLGLAVLPRMATTAARSIHRRLRRR